MKKSIRLNDLDCANCAAKIEDAVRGINGVTEVSVNFLSQRMTLETAGDEFEAILAKIKKAVKKVDSDITVSA